MKKLTILSLVAALTSTVTFTSCNSDDNNNALTGQTISNMTSVVESLDNPGSVSFCDLSFALVYDYDNNTSDVQILGMKLADGSQLPLMTFKGLSWRTKDYWKLTEAYSVMPTVEGFGNIPMFETFDIAIKDLYSSQGGYAPGFFYDFEINGSTRVYGPVYKGSTITTAPGGATFTNDDIKYVVTLHSSTSTADIQLFGASFIDGMPKLNLAFDAVPYTMNGDRYVFSVASLTPSFGGTPFPRFPITDLKGTLDFATGFDLEFTCGYNGEPYKVVADTDRG